MSISFCHRIFPRLSHASRYLVALGLLAAWLGMFAIPVEAMKLFGKPKPKSASFSSSTSSGHARAPMQNRNTTPGLTSGQVKELRNRVIEGPYLESDNQADKIIVKFLLHKDNLDEANSAISMLAVLQGAKKLDLSAIEVAEKKLLEIGLTIEPDPKEAAAIAAASGNVLKREQAIVLGKYIKTNNAFREWANARIQTLYDKKLDDRTIKSANRNDAIKPFDPQKALDNVTFPNVGVTIPIAAIDIELSNKLIEITQLIDQHRKMLNAGIQLDYEKQLLQLGITVLPNDEQFKALKALAEQAPSAELLFPDLQEFFQENETVRTRKNQEIDVRRVQNEHGLSEHEARRLVIHGISLHHGKR